MRFTPVVTIAVLTSAGSSALAQEPGPGKGIFETHCAVCHGGDGNGGEFAPGIVTRIVSRTDSDVTTVIVDGLPNRGMPPSKLNERDVGERTT